MQSKGKVFKKLLDANNNPEHVEKYIDQALELAFEHKGLASLNSSSQIYRPTDKQMTAYHDKILINKTNESMENFGAFEDLDPLLQLPYTKEPTPTSFNLIAGLSGVNTTRNNQLNLPV